MNRTDGKALLLIALLVLPAWAYPFLFPGYVGFDGDSLFLFYPAMELAREELLSGRLPLWNPYKFLGSPMMANLMVPVFYPPQLLGLLIPQPLGLHLTIVGHALWAAWGTYLAARKSLNLTAWSAVFAAVTYSLAAPMQLHATHPNQLYAMAWLPWVLASMIRWAESPKSWPRAAIVAGVLGLQGLAGQPQIVTYSAVLVLLGIVYSAFRSFRQTLVGLPLLGCAGLLAAGIAAVHLIPAIELSDYSPRAWDSEGFALSFSLPLENLVTLFLPGHLGAPGLGGYRGAWNFTETGIFLGRVPLFLLPLAFWGGRRTAVFWVVLIGAALVGLVWALGSSTPLYGGLLEGIPALSQFRAPARAFILVVLALSLLGALGLDALLRLLKSQDQYPRLRAIRVVAIILLLLAQTAALYDFRFRLLRPPLTKLEEALSPGWEQELLGIRGGEGRVFRLLNEIDYGDEGFEATRRKIVRIQPDISVLRRVSLMGGYDEGMLPLKGYVRFIQAYKRLIYSPQPNTRLLGIMGIRYLLIDKPVRHPALRPVAIQEDVALLENLDYRGMVFTREAWPDVQIDGVADLIKPGRHVARVTPYPAFRETGTLPLPRLREAQVIASTRLAPGRLMVEIPEGADRRILLSETWMPGWIAVTQEGERVEGQPIAPFLIEFRLPENARRAELLYRPMTFYLGLGISAGSLILLALTGIVSRRFARLARSTTDPEGAE